MSDRRSGICLALVPGVSHIAWVDESTPTKDTDEDWGERFSIEHHYLRCITPFNGELYAIGVNNLQVGQLVCTNSVQLEKRASTVKLETLHFQNLEMTSSTL